MLTEQENVLLELLFDLCPHWRDTITKQIYTADIKQEFTGSNMAIIFSTKEVPRLNFDTRVPVEILLGNVDLSNCVSNEVNGCTVISANRLFIPDDAISVLYIFAGGVIEEIEIFSCNGNRLESVLPIDKSRTYNVSNLNDIWNTRKS